LSFPFLRKRLLPCAKWRGKKHPQKSLDYFLHKDQG
jgi:hypothetical protein